MEDFSFVGTPNPARLAEVLSSTKALGYCTLVQDRFISDATCRVQGGRAKGAFSFKAVWYNGILDRLRGKGQPLYAGRIEYGAVLVDQKWRIEEFRLPNYKVRLVRGDDGVWK